MTNQQMAAIDRPAIAMPLMASWDSLVMGTVEPKPTLHETKQIPQLSRPALGQIAAFRRGGLSVVISAPGILDKVVFSGPDRTDADVVHEMESIYEAAI